MMDITGPSDELGPTPLAVEGPARDGPWFLRGSRVRAEGNDHRGLQLVESGDTTMMTGCSSSAEPASSIQLDPGLVTRIWSDGGVERNWTALSLPILVWEYNGAASAALEWQTPVGAGGGVAGVNGGTSRAALLANGGRVLFLTDGGVLSAELAGGAAHFRFEHTGAARVVAIAQADDADMKRTTDQLQRRGINGLATQRAQHSAHLGKLGTRLRTPEEAIDRAFSWAAILCEQAASGGALDAPGGGLLAAAIRAAGLKSAVRSAVAVGKDTAPASVDGAVQRLRQAGSQVDARSAEMFGPDPSRAAGVLVDGVHGLFGAAFDAAGDGLTLLPALPEGWTTMGLERLRVGLAVLDVDVRSRHSATIVSVRLRSGGPLMVTIGLPDIEVAQVELDDVVMPSPRARFEARNDHLLVFRHAD